jgi:dephospho-CoA kinase
MHSPSPDRILYTRSMYSIALTGGVASGKTAVTNRFAQLGIEIIDADIVSREVVAPGSLGLKEIVAHFGEDVLDSEGALNRRAMRERIFADATAKQALEAIVHPRVRLALLERAVSARSPYVILAIPLLAESSGYDWIDRVLVVDVSREIQLQRLTARDGVTPELAEAMLAAQASREQRLAIADDVIDNSGEIGALDAVVSALHARYLTLAQSRYPVDQGLESPRT